MEDGGGGGFDVEAEGGVFDLEGIYVVDFGGSTESFGGDFAEAYVADFAFTTFMKELVSKK